MNKKEKFVAKTFAGLEILLKDELEKLGAENCQICNRAVEFEGEFDMMYRANYFCRYALRILWQVHQFNFRDNKQFYDAIFNYPAEQILHYNGTLAVSTTMHDAIFKTPLFAAQLAKDAICDRFRDKYNERPSVDKENPDVQFHIHILRSQATLFLDSSGESLHKRGYRVSAHPAQINEVIAAGMVKLSGWNAQCDMIDPMCGSGTILIEAAMQALNIPAGFYRDNYGCFKWKNFDRYTWKKITDEADILDDVPITLYGFDISARFLGMAKANVKEARLSDFIRLSRCSMQDSEPKNRPAMLIFNPPYGERMEIDNIEDFYHEIGDALKKHYTNCTAFIISSNIEAIKNIGLHASKKYTLFNGALECKYLKFDLYQGSKSK